MAFFIVERHSHKFLNLYVFSRLEVVNFMFEILKEYNRYSVLANHRSFNVFLSAKKLPVYRQLFDCAIFFYVK